MAAIMARATVVSRTLRHPAAPGRPPHGAVLMALCMGGVRRRVPSGRTHPAARVVAPGHPLAERTCLVLGNKTLPGSAGEGLPCCAPCRGRRAGRAGSVRVFRVAANRAHGHGFVLVRREHHPYPEPPEPAAVGLVPLSPGCLAGDRGGGADAFEGKRQQDVAGGDHRSDLLYGLFVQYPEQPISHLRDAPIRAGGVPFLRGRYGLRLDLAVGAAPETTAGGRGSLGVGPGAGGLVGVQQPGGVESGRVPWPDEPGGNAGGRTGARGGSAFRG